MCLSRNWNDDIHAAAWHVLLGPKFSTAAAVVYVFTPSCAGGGNPMRPHRVRLTNSQVNGYGLTSQLQLHRPRPRSYEELTEFHADGEHAHTACSIGEGRAVL